MSDLENDIANITGISARIHPVTPAGLKWLALYIREAYNLYELNLNDTNFLLVEPLQEGGLRLLQIQKHLTTLATITEKKCILLLKELPAYLLTRLVKKRINFIVPNKQIYLPDLWMHLQKDERKETKKKDKTVLTPTAQFLLLYHLLHHHDLWQLEKYPLKDIAEHTGYRGNTITVAARELEEHQLITIKGTKEKYIQFKLQGKELWGHVLKEGQLTTPVLKRVYVDVKPENTPLLKANATALPEYSDMNPDIQEYYAIDKNSYYTLEKANKLRHPNPTEGQYCLEVWKYDPARLAAHVHTKDEVVDPLSLYLSMQDMKDERIEMALDQIVNTFPW